jgi:hypothetical protein
MSYPGEKIPRVTANAEREPAAQPEDLGRYFPERANADLALTSTRLPAGGATVEVARRQPDGSWRWVIDQPAVLS